MSQGPSEFPHSQMAGPHLPECQRWEDLAVVCDSRGRKASTTAVCDTRRGNTSCLSARAGMGARGGGQEATMVPSPGGLSCHQPMRGMGHCSYLPGSLSSLVVPRNPQSKVNNPWGNTQPASDCGDFLQVSAVAGIPHISQLCLLCLSLSPAQLSK